jgi:hypothetical protein
MSTRVLSFALALASCTTSHPTPRRAAARAGGRGHRAAPRLADTAKLAARLKPQGGLELATLGLPPYLVPAPAGSSPK